MRKHLKEKFVQIKQLAHFSLKTDTTALAEVNPNDDYLGVKHSLIIISGQKTIRKGEMSLASLLEDIFNFPAP